MVRLFNSRKKRLKKRRLSRNQTSEPPRRGKTRMPNSRGRKQSDKQIKKLRKSGYRRASRRPIGTLTDREWRDLQDKVKNKDVEVVIEPPKWKGEAPREWLFYRRKA